MPKKKQRYLLETSILRKLIWGIELERGEINSLTRDGTRFTSEYCLKEFYVGVIKALIEFYFLFKNDSLSSSQEDVSAFSQKYGTRTPKLMMVIIAQLNNGNFTNNKVEDSALIKTYILDLFQKVNFQLVNQVVSNSHKCGVSKLKITELSDTQLRDFYNGIEDLYKNEPINICKIKKFLDEKKDIIVPMHKASLKEVREMSENATRKINSCGECSHIGDLVIAMESTDLTLVTLDRSQARMCKLQSRPYALIENTASKIMQASRKKI